MCSWFKKIAIFGLMGMLMNMACADSFDDFFKAIKIGDVRVIKSLLYRGIDPNLVDENGQSALTLSILQGQSQVALALINAKGINIDQRNAYEETPLMIAALNGDEKVMDLLISRDAEINKTGWTPLHYAASKGQLKAMQILLDNSAYIDAESPNHSTPLMMAAGYGSSDSVKLLIEAGADPRLINEKGLNAKDFADLAKQNTSSQMLELAMKEWAIKYPKVSIP